VKDIKLFCMDVDGVLTDGGMYYSESGDELKKFNTRDGHGAQLLREAGIKTAIITNENTKIVERRAQKLKIDEVHQGAGDKGKIIEELSSRLGIPLAQTAYIGDDINDIGAMGKVGLPIAVADAHEKAKAAAQLVTKAKGGEGAVREAAEYILE